MKLHRLPVELLVFPPMAVALFFKRIFTTEILFLTCWSRRSIGFIVVAAAQSYSCTLLTHFDGYVI